MTPKLRRKLRNPGYRKAFVESMIQIGIPFQLRAMMKKRGWTQTDLAQRAGMKQAVISRLIAAGHMPNLRTLLRLAEAFDCALTVRFAPFGELAEWSDNFSPDTFAVPSFDQE
jgi:transcriptional regulator with XRE-family HTH domain